MYDAWAAYDDEAVPYMLGQTIRRPTDVSGFTCSFQGVSAPVDVKAAREEAISYAAYRLLSHRFTVEPRAEEAQAIFDSVMTELDYDAGFTSIDYHSGKPAALGNYIAECMIEFGLQDYSNEQGNYAHDAYHTPANPFLDPRDYGTMMTDINRWQPLAPAGTPRKFLGPHWGLVHPFAMTEEDLTIYNRDGYEYWVYHDPGDPPYVDTTGTVMDWDDAFKYTHALVAVWSGHLDPASGVMIDISPGNMGTLPELPTDVDDINAFYDLLEGGNPWTGYEVNPKTGEPYAENMIPLGDFGRVIAEFWADGPTSETPPGHWFTLANYVSDHPLFEKRWQGEGEILDDLEWDVKAYLPLGGAVHDVAVAVWGVKAWYDFVRPISAIRYMAELGQSSDPALPSYHPSGIPLIENHIELIDSMDTLAGDSLENVGKIKLWAWKGPDAIQDPDNDVAGVGWILAGNWWPYQRPSFTTPPFAGYISGHSTFSRAAAEVMTLITGDEYFPGGLGEFEAKQNEYLVFEDGPSVDVTLQWAKYRDASNQASLSRIWGGIHPPVDDIPGRIMGTKIAPEAVDKANTYYNGTVTSVADNDAQIPTGFALYNAYPNPFNPSTSLQFDLPNNTNVTLAIFNQLGQKVATLVDEEYLSSGTHKYQWNAADMASGVYFYSLRADNQTLTRKMMLIK
jgi:hypothetical protein